ncbi:NAD(P)/FAD-dependent oxidoreductase [Rheinheimera maricola]|uniref:FAD-binding oxidoreductase n=1 Tax=Rheinheimera maricola TaxID=2793282 RepID=A0ABS7XAX9_9GAMM|nr:FAD-binding oxidoreductase [Rheinheimera maricola]
MQQLCIIGGGIVGLCNALFLQQAGFDVLLLDANAVGSGCSAGNAGHFATEQVFPLAQPALLRQLPAMLLNPLGPLRIRSGYLLQALPWFARFVANMRKDKRNANQQALSGLNHASLASWQKLLHSCQLSQQIQYRGALLVTERSDLTALQQQYQAYRDAGIDVRWCKQNELLQLEPALSAKLTAALDFTEVAHSCDPLALCQQLYQQFCQLGGRYMRTDVRQIIPTPKRHRLICSHGDINAEQVIIAAGAHSAQLTRQLGWPVPLEAERGYHLMLQAADLSRPVSSLERKCIMTPMQHGLRVAGTAEFAGLQAKPDYQRAIVLQQHADQLLRQRTAAVRPEAEAAEHVFANHTVWAGNRPSLPDSLPVLGSCPRHTGIYYNFGHQHLGLTQAAFSAELLTSCLLKQTPALDLTPFRINRF